MAQTYYAGGSAPSPSYSLTGPMPPLTQPKPQPDWNPQQATAVKTTVATAAPASTATTKAANATGYDPTLRQVDSPTETVAGQMEGLLSSNSDYMKRAETAGIQGAASRGLVNSSMAVGAAHASAIDAALPIAQQDANTYHTQGRANQDATNRASEFGASAENQASIFNAGESNKTSMFNAGETNKTNQFNATEQNRVGMFNAGEENDASMFNAGEANKGDLINLEYGNRSQLDRQQHEQDMAKQNDQQAHDMERLGSEQTFSSFQDYMDKRQEIQMSDLTAEAKQAKLNNLDAAWITSSPVSVAVASGSWVDGVYVPPGTNGGSPAPANGTQAPANSKPTNGTPSPLPDNRRYTRRGPSRIGNGTEPPIPSGSVNANGDWVAPAGARYDKATGTYTHKTTVRGGRGNKHGTVTVWNRNGKVIQQYSWDNGS